MIAAAERARKAERADPEDLVWRALADPSRRRILDRLRRRPQTTGEIADDLPFSRFAAMKHLAVLVEAGLVVVERREGRRWNHLNPVPFVRVLGRWIRPFEAGRAEGLLRLKALVEDREEGRA